MGCHFLLQEVFPTQGSNPYLYIVRWVLYHSATWEALRRIYMLKKSNLRATSIECGTSGHALFSSILTLTPRIFL